ncbi:MAG: protein kinase domain-containing protein, partial [Halothece sp.]
MLGTKLRDRYYIFKELGVGGFGQTFLAKDYDFPGKPWCVVKQLKPQVNELWMLQTARRLFDQEASVLARIGSHPQIPQLMAHFEENNQFYLVQEFIDGNLLSKELKEGKTWTQQDAIAFLQDILGVLKFIHDNHVIHRDLKPENIIRRHSDQKLVLIDFGSVKKVTTLQEEESEENTGFTVAIGTPSYMPLEQQGGKPSYNSDIYALGKIILKGLSGVSPKHLSDDPITGELSWRHLVDIDDDFAQVLSRMVRISPRDRYQTITEILNDLNLGIADTSPASPLITAKADNNNTLNCIVHNLKQHPEITRIKKMLFCACKHRWENSSKVLIKYRTKSLLQELYQREADFSSLKQTINDVVSTLNKKDKYQNIANIILAEIKPLYETYNPIVLDNS